MPSAAKYFSLSSAADSPPLVDQPTPMTPELAMGSTLSSRSMVWERVGNTSLMAMAPSTLDFSMPRGILMSVTLAGQGVMKKQPTSFSRRPVFSMASSLAIRAAVSMGDLRGSTWSHRSGKRTRMSRTTAGQAELMMGRGRGREASELYISLRVASLTSSAARETSYTWSKPIFFRPVST